MVKTASRAKVLIGVILAGLLAGGCAIRPGASPTCPFVRRALAVNDPANVQLAGLAESRFAQSASVPARAGTLAADVREALSKRAARGTAEPAETMLFLSGGSLNGAFGAGFLDEWHRQRGGLPRFAVVTGVSTGAILSTFAFIDRPDIAVRGYTIREEGDLLRPYTRSGPKIGLKTGLVLLRRGAIADLEPLRIRLADVLTNEVLTAVKDGWDDGRRLYVGAVDVDQGEAVAFDLTDMAAKWFAASAADKPRLRDCYVSVILASSSAPIAAPPVFIDDRMYVDGGARFGVFSDEIGRILDDRASAGALAEPPPRTFVIVNGDQLIADRSQPAGQHPPWTFLDLALRSEGILANQVYRFSVDKIAARARLNSRDFFFAKIEPDVLDFAADLDGEGGEPARPCRDWRQRDGVGRPLQFYPLYMQCLIEYGRARASAELPRWSPLDPS